jgi:hypothetical protein
MAARSPRTCSASRALPAFAVGAVAVLWQKRPERRIGTLASLQGGILLAALAAERAGHYHRISVEDLLGQWAPHLVLALTGAGTFARFLPVSGSGADPAAVMFRRHPLSAAFGLFALASLAGVPGTPGARLWLDVARALAGSERMGLMLALAAAWLASFAVAVRQARDAIGVARARPGAGAARAVVGARRAVVRRRRGCWRSAGRGGSGAARRRIGPKRRLSAASRGAALRFRLGAGASEFPPAIEAERHPQQGDEHDRRAEPAARARQRVLLAEPPGLGHQVLPVVKSVRRALTRVAAEQRQLARARVVDVGRDVEEVLAEHHSVLRPRRTDRASSAAA